MRKGERRRDGDRALYTSRDGTRVAGCTLALRSWFRACGGPSERGPRKRRPRPDSAFPGKGKTEAIVVGRTKTAARCRARVRAVQVPWACAVSGFALSAWGRQSIEATRVEPFISAGYSAVVASSLQWAVTIKSGNGRQSRRATWS